MSQVDQLSNQAPTANGSADPLAGLSLDEKRALIAKLLKKDSGAPRMFPLSEAQERLWLVDQWEPGSATYHSCIAVRLEGNLDADAMQRALNEVVRRHETLRTTFSTVGNKPMQIVAPQTNIPLPLRDLGDVPEAQREAEAARQADAEVRRPIDLSKGPIFRALLLKLAPDVHDLIVTIHHIVFDGWSAGIFIREACTLYAAFAAGKPSPLPALPTQYGDFTVWQRQWLQSGVLERQLAYWKNALAGCQPILELPTDRPRPALLKFNGANRQFRLSTELSRKLRELSQQEGVTLFMTLLAAFQTLLSRYSRQEDLLVGCHIAGRGRQEVENLIGVFVNTLAMRGDLSGNPTFRELLQRVRTTAVGAFSNPDLPFNKVVEAVHPDRDLSRAPLVQVAFGLRNTPWHAVELADLRLTPRNADTGTSKYDMTLYMSDVEAELFGRLEYNTELFEPATSARLIDQFHNLLESATANPGQRLSELSLMKPAERHMILFEWNQSQTRLHESAASIVTLIEEQARRAPEKIAVVCEGKQLTYAELNNRANALAHYLRGQGVGRDQVVGICLDRSLDMVVAVLAVMKAGGAYIPLNVEHAPDRLKFILESAGALLVLTDRAIHERQGDLGTPAVCLDAIAPQLLQQSVHNPDVAIVGDSLAYILFTSGSTGRPKGVMIDHSCLLNAFRAWDEIYHLSEWSPTYLQMANFSFDVWPGDFVRALCSGGKLVLCPTEALLEAEQLHDLIVREGITATEFVPVVLRNLTSYLERTGRRLNGVRLLVVGADVWYVKDHARLKTVVGPNTRVLNSYGITEATIDSSIFEGDVADLPPDGVVPIGKPFPNTRMYILDKQMQPVPIGMPGELYIGGPSLARGYVGRDDLTAERFIRNPFSSSDTRYPIPDTRFYKTGDLARWRSDGNIEFLGRADFQVKIRGFRIEPGEIETTLLSHPDVHEAVVVARHDDLGERRLVAYLTRKPNAKQTESINVGDIRDFVRGRLPEYMLPSAFVVLDSWPLTPSGKMNRAALPVPDWSRPDASETFVAPRNQVEGELARICQEVLRLDRVGIHDNFFALGGDSIRAVQLVASAGRSGLKLTPRQVFQHQTVAGWASAATPLSAKAELDESRSSEPLIRLSEDERVALNAAIGKDASLISEVYPLTPAQQGILFHTLEAPGSGVYIIQVSGRLRGLDVAAFRRAWERLLERHEPLRTGFIWQNVSQPLQVVYQSAALPWTEFDWSDLSDVERDQRWQKFLQDDRANNFDLLHPPLMRIALAKETGNSYRFVWTHHHLVIDGWSLPLVLREMVTLYDAERSGAAVPPPPRRFRDYIAWLVKQDLAKAEEYWRRTLAGFAAPTPVGLKLSNETGGPTERRAEVSASATSALERFSRQHGLTMNTIVQGAWALLLGRYADQDDVVFGQAVSGRPADLPGVETMVGMFINTLPVRVKLKADQPVLEWLRELQNQQTEQLDYAYSPLMKVQGWSEVPRGTPLFESLVAFENYPIDSAINSEKSGFAAQGVSGRQQVSYPLALQVNPGATLRLNLMYDRGRLDTTAAERLLGHLRTLLEGMAANPEQPLGELPMLLPAERQKVLVEWSGGQESIAVSRCIPDWFAEQVRLRPQAVAVVYENQSITYAELERRANRLAHHLRNRGVGPDAIVAVFLDRSLDLVVALLGIVKAGGAYLPMEPSYPVDRLAFMLEDSQAPVVVTAGKLAESLPSIPIQILLVDQLNILPAVPETAPESEIVPDHLAYVIYTSGSTGKPKGVQITHRNVIRLFEATNDWFGFDQTDVWTMFHSYAFDFSVWEIWGALLYGGRLVIVPYDVSRSFDEFYDLLVAERVTVLNQTPSAFRQVIAVDGQREAKFELALRYVIFGGEALELGCLRPWIDRHGDERPKLINMYGITETTVHVTYRAITSADIEGASGSVIGVPIPDLHLYLLDRNAQPVPVGVPGEIYVGGDGVARGYLNRPHLNEERFLADRYRAGGRVYRSGDLARWHANGDLEYLGRIDQQVKIRGFRIELGEIETVLGRHPDVRDVAVIAREDSPGDKRLAAYVVPKHASIRSSDLRSFARERLPDYMVPSAFVVIESLPLTSNGKLDRKALPAPDSSLAKVERELTPLRTTTENQIAAIWADLLKVERIGVYDNFFELGGDSLLAARAAGKIGTAIGCSLSIRQFFEHPTVGALAALLEKQAAADGVAPLRLQRRAAHAGPLPLSSSQEGFYLVTKLHPDMPAHQMCGSIRVVGDLNVQALQRAFNEVVRRHDALRASFRLESEKPIQVIRPYVPFEIPQFDLSDIPERDREKAINSIYLSNRFELFDIPNGPLYRIKLLRLGSREHIVLFASHHIIFDGASFDVLLREIMALYPAFKAGRASPLPELSFQYGDYLLWLQDYLQNQDIEKLKDYFERKMAKVKSLDLPTDFPRPRTASGKGASLRIDLPAELSEAIQYFHSQFGVTPFMTLLAAYQVVLNLISGQEYIYVSSPTDNRVPSETESLIGCFTKMLHLNTHVGGDPTFAELVDRNRDEVLEAYEKQILPIQVLRAAIAGGQAPEANRQRNLGVLFTLNNFMSNAARNSQSPVLQMGDLQIAPCRFDASVVDTLLRETGKNEQDQRSRDAQVADLALNFRYENSRFVGDLNYRADLFRPETIRRFRDYFLRALTFGLESPTKKLSESPILTEPERQWLLSRWQPLPDVEEGASSWVHRIIEENAGRNPDAVAIRSGDKQLTYGELNGRANQVAHFLLNLGVSFDRPVAIGVDDLLKLIVIELGVLKAGGFYMALDPDQRDERLAFLVHDSQASVLLTQRSCQERFGDAGCKTIYMEEIAGELQGQIDSNPTVEVVADSPAYLVYAPNTAGEWNGVRVGHAALANACRAWEAEYRLRDHLHAHLLAANPASDRFTAAWVRALGSGAKLVICPREFLANPEQMDDLMRREQVDALEVVPIVARRLMTFLRDADKRLDFLRLLAVGSDVWHLGEYLRLKTLCGPTTRVISTFGVPEATNATSLYESDSPEGLDQVVPFGRPFPNTRFYVLDRYQRVSPVDVWGELHIGGPGVALDYWNRPRLTAERFVADSIDGQSGSRLFKTDLRARWRTNGKIELQDRRGRAVTANDVQVESSGVDWLLKQHRWISDAVIVARNDSGNTGSQLVAYIVPLPGATLALHEIRSYLSRQELPRQSIPAAYVLLPALPMTVSGRLDVHALPEPTSAELLAPAGYVAPTTPMEERLCAIMGEVLGIERVGIYDDFFALGGDSMTAMQIAVKARQEFGVDQVPITGLFVSPNVAELAARIAAAPKAETEVNREDPVDRVAEETTERDAPAKEADGLDELAYRQVQLDWSRLPLVPLQASGSNRPFFLVHGIDGSVAPFAALASQFANDRPVFGLQARGLYFRGAPIERIEEIAAYYCDAIRAEQPHGPYFLGGWSMGGLIAMEMARQFDMNGETVDPLVLLDPFFPAARAKKNMGRLLQQDDAALFADAFPKLFSELGVPVRQFKVMSSQQRSEIIWKKFEKINAQLLKMDLATLNSMLLTRRAHMRALCEYQPSLYSGPILFLESGGDQLARIAPWQPSANWRQLLPIRTSFIVPGSHRGMLSGTHAGGLAQVIQTAFIEHQKAIPE